MSAAVVITRYDVAPSELQTLLSGNKEGGGIRFVHVSHGEGAPEDTNLVLMARKNADARRCLVELSKSGYYAYCTMEGCTRFVRSDRVETLWLKVKSGDFIMTKDELVYTVTPPADGRKPARLLVVFSSIHENPNSASLHRYFTQNFPSIQKYIPQDTAVLRIGDLGGVLGAFYLNTVHRPGNAAAVQKLIVSMRIQLGVDPDAMVLYGASKGGTAAFYHGMLGGHRFVAVDPIVADEHYVKNIQDFHFTVGGVFPETKEQVFERFVREIRSRKGRIPPSTKHTVICSERSPQFRYISKMLIDPLRDRVAFFNSRNPAILDHPDVGKHTVNTATMLLNMQLYGLQILPGVTDID